MRDLTSGYPWLMGYEGGREVAGDGAGGGGEVFCGGGAIHTRCKF